MVTYKPRTIGGMRLTNPRSMPPRKISPIILICMIPESKQALGLLARSARLTLERVNNRILLAIAAPSIILFSTRIQGALSAGTSTTTVIVTMSLTP